MARYKNIDTNPRLLPVDLPDHHSIDLGLPQTIFSSVNRFCMYASMSKLT
jgi:hypothetical protein